MLATKLILEKSPVLMEMVDKKELIIVAAMHDLTTGQVNFLS
jgi:hypothetical protein